MLIRMKTASEWFFLLCSSLAVCVQSHVLLDAPNDIKGGARPVSHHRHEAHGHDVCRTQACHLAATDLLNALNMSVDPCEDFYGFTCGGWIKSHPIPDSESHSSTFEQTREIVDHQVKDILEKPSAPADLGPVMAAKDAYKVCMNVDLIELEGLDSLVKLSAKLGGWPMATRDWNGALFDTQRILAEIATLGVGPFYAAGVTLDRKNTTIRVITLDQPSLGLSRSMLTEAKTYTTQIKAYKQWMAKTALEMAKAQNYHIPAQQIYMEVEELIEFEINLAKLTSKSEMRRNIERLYNPMTLRELQEWTDSAGVVNDHAQVDWLEFVRILFSGVDVEIDLEERVIVRELDFLFKVVALLDETPQRVVANYIQWRVIKTLASETTEKMRSLVFDYEKVILGVKEMLPRWRSCVSKISNLLGYAVGYEYVRAHFDQEAKKSAVDMVTTIREAFSKRMNRVDWMDETTRLIALDKANSMLEAIGFPDWFNNATALEDYYKQVNIGEVHFENMMQLDSLSVLRSLRKLGKPNDRTEWITSPEVVNAFYNPPTNAIVFPAAILQPPFYNKGRPEALNYGSIGMVIGHEITHGFDDVGRQSDKYGNLAQWWSKTTLETYLKKAQCFIDQYDNYRVPELDEILNITARLNGVTTQGENIADSGGLNTAFLAYRMFLQKHGPQPRLPGLERYNSEQLFFMGFGSMWCESLHKEALLHAVLTDAHSPHKFRIDGSLANSKDFARVFDCPPGSPMNPEKKCFIW